MTGTTSILSAKYDSFTPTKVLRMALQSSGIKNNSMGPFDEKVLHIHIPSNLKSWKSDETMITFLSRCISLCIKLDYPSG